MATTAEIQAQIDSGATGRVANIVRSNRIDGTLDEHYTVGMTGRYKGRARWCQTTAADSAATQAAAILAKLVE